VIILERGHDAVARALHPHRLMPASRRAIVLAFAISTIIACEDPFTNGAPADSPGAVVPGIANVCPFGFGCSAWSADSKTLYIVAGVKLLQGLGSLMAVDAATLTSRVVGPIDVETVVLAPTADGAGIYFEAPDPAPPGGWLIKRMSLSDGATTTVAKNLGQFNFVVSPDGTAVAYHAPSSTLAADTIVVLDLSSGMRRATTIMAGFNTLAAFSADGTQVSIIPNARSIQIWHLTTGARDTIPVSRANSVLSGAAWSGGAFRVLLRAFVGAKTFTDTSLAGGSALTYTVEQDPSRFLWLPDRSAMWTIPETPICGPQDCTLKRFDFVYTTATKALTVGDANSVGLLLLSASPDGHWVAHAEGPDALYLLHRPTP
jgi:hypothetical protein